MCERNITSEEQRRDERKSAKHSARRRVMVLNDQGGAVMHISYDVTATLRSNTKNHEPIVLIYDSRGNGGGGVSPTITGDHQNRITDYTAIVVTSDEDEESV